MDKEEFINEVLNKGMRLTPEALDLIDSIEDKKEIFNNLSKGEFTIITKDDLSSIISEYEKIPEAKIEIKTSKGFHPLAKEYSPNIKLYPEKDITEKSRCTGKPEDFISYFRSRFFMSKELFSSRIGTSQIIKIKDLKLRSNEEVRVIGIVIDKRESKKGNLVVEIEDEEEVGLVIIPQSEPDIYALSNNLIIDDIVMFEGKTYNGLLIAKEIIWPDVPVMKEKKTIKEDLAVAYLSDLHIGSKFFMEKEFNNFLEWLNGKNNDEIAGKIKYICISGDVVDGIGIYPGQEEELIVRDIYKQYDIFTELIENVPDHIEIIASPGNHDAVRRAQPQPKIPNELLKGRTITVGSPSWVDIEGFKHLIYHGDSLDSIISALASCTYSKPEDPMIELLKRRNLSPIYGKNSIVPEKKDYLMIDEVPDVLHMGHIHKNGYAVYRNTHIINSGTFQERTGFQVKQGHIPTPGIVPILMLQTGEIVHKKFVGDQNS